MARSQSSNSYRFGFNGKENDSKEWGNSLIQDYGFRLYNPALGRFLSVDPLQRSYPELTPYQFASNTPIYAIDLDGLEGARRASPRTNPILRAAHVRSRAARSVRSMINRQEQLDQLRRSRELFEGGISAEERQSISIAGQHEFGSDASVHMEYRARNGESGNSYMVYQDLERVNRILQDVADKKILSADDTNYYNEHLRGDNPEINVLNKAAQGTDITVGRWMSREEYNSMVETQRVQEGAGGQTFVANSDPDSFRKQAPKGSVYVEFETDPKNLLQGGNEDWFKFVGPEANKVSQFKLKKQGGEMLPRVHNIQIKDTK